jgi:hypothetical protein
MSKISSDADAPAAKKEEAPTPVAAEKKPEAS